MKINSNGSKLRTADENPDEGAARTSSVRRRNLVCAAAFVFALSTIGCGKPPKLPEPVPPPKPVEAHVTIAAGADANPDGSGRPSPVVVRVYQLTADAAFTGADFFGLFDDEQKVLGAELVSRTEIVLAPSERRTIDIAVSADARFLGAIAAFRDIRNSEWRVLVPTWREGLKNMTVSVERARVVLSVAE
jgi:type VI secretion system protein VasD